MTAKIGASYLGLQGRCEAIGDFDAQVEYSLLSWPPNTIAALRLAAQGIAHGPGGHVGVLRSSSPYGFRSTSEISEKSGVNDSDTSGKLRLVRTGTTVWDCHHDGKQIVLINSSPTDLNPARLLIDFGGDSSGQIVIVVDNFRVTADAISC